MAAAVAPPDNSIAPSNDSSASRLFGGMRAIPTNGRNGRGRESSSACTMVLTTLTEPPVKRKTENLGIPDANAQVAPVADPVDTRWRSRVGPRPVDTRWAIRVGPGGKRVRRHNEAGQRRNSPCGHRERWL